jgi:hypothetical protein
MATQFGRAVQHDVRYQLAVFAHFDIRADEAEWADTAGCRNLCAGIDNCGGVDIHCTCFQFVCC